MNPHKETLFRVGDFEILRNGRFSPLFLFFCKNSIVYRWKIDTTESKSTLQGSIIYVDTWISMNPSRDINKNSDFWQGK